MANATPLPSKRWKADGHATLSSGEDLMSALKPNSGKLLPEFPPVSAEDWRKLVEAELKGAPFEKKMFTGTYEGITLKPIYRREDVQSLPHVNSFPGFAPFVRGATASG